ncbi:Pycsar system effector family protein [Paraburkholderia haematera]|uniref:Pycsar effector protein domain-containing protein n=1 Tax=Paraburkholderia haematera TaxID=2793077 RepID=A0ABM8RID9_9BURK|nr:Pycsar system effector family protein [Paraburkholderia haematera]CAE6754594.1 hypothetical protein R69888_03122 [Paraburkholderia haematera]
MNDAEQVKTFQAMAEVSRKWVTTLDAKAGFLVAINGALLGFVFSSAKLTDCPLHWVRVPAYVAAALALASLLLAATVVFPRIKLDVSPSVGAVTFFAYVASKYAEPDGKRFVVDVFAMSDRDLAREALEQHHAISHVAMIKNTRVTHASTCWLGALIFTVGAVLIKAAG